MARPDGDALALAARELARLAVEERRRAQDLGGLVRPAGRSRPWGCRRAAGRSPCSARRSYADRARRTGTPWRDRAGRRHVVDDLAVDGDRAAGDLLEPAMRRSRVDLPQPDGPTKTTNSPSPRRGRCREAPRTLLKDFRTSRSIRLANAASSACVRGFGQPADARLQGEHAARQRRLGELLRREPDPGAGDEKRGEVGPPKAQLVGRGTGRLMTRSTFPSGS
jgi:hypothetical protein